MRLTAILLFLASLVLAQQQIQYTYDKAGRVTKADYGGGNSIRYTYDASGNLTKREATTPPVVTTVSSASFSLGPVAPDEAVSAFGEGFSSSTAGWTGPPAPLTLAGTRVDVIDSQGASHQAPLFFVSPGFINYVIPSAAALGTATVRITPASGPAVEGKLDIQRIGPGLFTANASGSGAPAAYYIRVPQTGDTSFEFLFDGTTLAPKPFNLGPQGDQVFLAMFGTGFRGHQGNLSATVGGVSVPVQGALAQGLPALDQVNLGPLPRTLVGRGLVNVVVTFDGKPANVTQVVIQ